MPDLELGRTLITRTLANRVAANPTLAGHIAGILVRHQLGDWGDLDHADHDANDEALTTGARLLSAYEIPGMRVWIITEAEDDSGHRAATTVLLPEDY